MHIGFLLLALLGGVGSGYYVNRSGLNDPKLSPTIMGAPAVPVLAIGGLAAALWGGALLGPIGVGIAIASLVSGDAIKQTKEGIDTFLAKQAAGGGPGGGTAPVPPALPGPVEPRRGANAPGWLRAMAPRFFEGLAPGAEAAPG